MEKKVSESESVKERGELFKKYVEPNLGLIYTVCRRFTKRPVDVDDNYQECLMKFYKYIRTYDPTKNLNVWLHVVTKRHVTEVESKRDRRRYELIGVDDNPEVFSTSEDDYDNEINIDNYKECISDEVLDAIESIPNMCKFPLLMQLSGYKLKEIMDISYKNGTLKNKNLETVKSRIFLARRYLKDILADYYASRGD